ncbi:hypothetical protein CRUP_016194 [Coryphaenoides rupestris]|nr:hypothetical protein CRUP_016194 [Coryphaenoides rupestris]
MPGGGSVLSIWSSRFSRETLCIACSAWWASGRQFLPGITPFDARIATERNRNVVTIRPPVRPEVVAVAVEDFVHGVVGQGHGRHVTMVQGDLTTGHEVRQQLARHLDTRSKNNLMIQRVLIEASGRQFLPGITPFDARIATERNRNVVTIRPPLQWKTLSTVSSARGMAATSQWCRVTLPLATRPGPCPTSRTVSPGWIPHSRTAFSSNTRFPTLRNLLTSQPARELVGSRCKEESCAIYPDVA